MSTMPTSKGLLKKIYSPIDQTNPFLTIGYDALGRMVQQIDANNCTWDFYRATYRNEILPPAQVDTNGVSGRFGSSTLGQSGYPQGDQQGRDGPPERPLPTMPRPRPESGDGPGGHVRRVPV